MLSLRVCRCYGPTSYSAGAIDIGTGAIPFLFVNVARSGRCTTEKQHRKGKLTSVAGNFAHPLGGKHAQKVRKENLLRGPAVSLWEVRET